MEYKNKKNRVRCDDKRLEIYYKLMDLKKLYRQGWLKKGLSKEQCESVADHSFGTAILAMLLAPDDLDRNRVIELALIHEAGESIIGDITPHDNISAKEKQIREKEAVKTLFSDFDDAEYYLNLWNEFEFGKSKEAEFVRQLDKLEMALQSQSYQATKGFDSSDFIASAEKKIQIPLLVKIMDIIKDK